MNKIKVFHRNQPCLDITESDMKIGPNVGKKYGLNRDRNPDRDWSELRRSCMSACLEVEETPELRKILLEDLAYTYGSDTSIFSSKLIEFGFFKRNINGELIM
jgi:hypothetical protein